MPKATKKRVIAFPYFFKNDTLHVVLVTNKKGDHWILPKGHTEKKFKRASVALIESFEEAGVRGFLGPQDLSLEVTQEKKNHTIIYYCYPIIVDSLLPNWEEDSFRKRITIPLEEALEKVFSTVNYEIIKQFARRLGSPTSADDK